VARRPVFCFIPVGFAVAVPVLKNAPAPLFNLYKNNIDFLDSGMI
jgi:hypothetical protein